MVESALRSRKRGDFELGSARAPTAVRIASLIPRPVSQRASSEGAANVRSTARTRIASACLLAASLLVSTHALADARTEAKSHFKKGMGLISDGKYEEGISELQRAYEILPHPNVLYNIAR